MKTKDPDPDKKITNADEQDVVVNQSTAEHGFDEPSPEKEAAPEPAAEKTKNEERRESIEK